VSTARCTPEVKEDEKGKKSQTRGCPTGAQPKPASRLGTMKGDMGEWTTKVTRNNSRGTAGNGEGLPRELQKGGETHINKTKKGQS